jgi:hypothetical protein
MSTSYDEETTKYRKIIDDAIKKLKKLLPKHDQPTQLFWTDFNNI